MQVHALEVQEDVNRVLFGLSAPAAANGQPRKQSGKGGAAGGDARLSAKLQQHVLTEGGSKEQDADVADMLDSLRVC